MSPIIGSSEQKAPHAIQVLCQAFRTPNKTEQLKGVLAGNVKLSAVGWINKTISAFEGETPDKAINVFKDVVAPTGAVLTGGMNDINKIDDHTWTVEVLLHRTVNKEQSNCVIFTTCTLANDLISHIEMEVDPAL